MRVLVCGGREYRNWERLYEVLDGLDVTEVVEGGARGADRLAREWALSRLIPIKTFKADWKKDGRAAGPKRNQRMLNEATPDLVVAFLGGRGTADMVRRASNALVPVQLVLE